MAAIALILAYEFFEISELGLAMGVIGQAMPFATVIAFNTLGIIQINSGWRSSVAISAIISVAYLLIYITIIKEKRKYPSRSFI